MFPNKNDPTSRKSSVAEGQFNPQYFADYFEIEEEDFQEQWMAIDNELTH